MESEGDTRGLCRRKVVYTIMYNPDDSHFRSLVKLSSLQ